MSIKNDILKNALLLESGEDDDDAGRDIRKTACSLLHQAYTHKDMKKAKLSLAMIRNDKIKKMVEKAIEDCDWDKIKRAMLDL